MAAEAVGRRAEEAEGGREEVGRRRVIRERRQRGGAFARRVREFCGGCGSGQGGTVKELSVRIPGPQPLRGKRILKL